ncbi:MAG: hypothetical protein U5L45_22820 [Saprospiraceae bacterium]|nr:hypothetical protein [Saprospiraceae bacterium]
MKPYINSKYALKGTFALASLAQKEERVVHFSGKARKMNNIFPLARAKRAREPAVWILCMVSNLFNVPKIKCK